MVEEDTSPLSKKSKSSEHTESLTEKDNEGEQTKEKDKDKELKDGKRNEEVKENTVETVDNDQLATTLTREDEEESKEPASQSRKRKRQDEKREEEEGEGGEGSGSKSVRLDSRNPDNTADSKLNTIRQMHCMLTRGCEFWVLVASLNVARVAFTEMCCGAGGGGGDGGGGGGGSGEVRLERQDSQTTTDTGGEEEGGRSEGKRGRKRNRQHKKRDWETTLKNLQLRVMSKSAPITCTDLLVTNCRV